MGKILITGSSGQLGSYLIENIPESIGVDMKASQYTQLVWDLRKNPEEILKDYEIGTIIHAAAQVSVVKSVEVPKFDAENNIMGTINLLEYARKHDVEHFIYISSAAVYGESKYLPIDEEHPTEPESPYGLSKLTGEKYALLYHKLYGIKVASVRPFNIFSPRQDPKNPYSGVISIFVERAKKGLPLIIHGDGEQTRDFVNIEDVVQLIKLSIAINKKIFLILVVPYNERAVLLCPYMLKSMFLCDLHKLILLAGDIHFLPGYLFKHVTESIPCFHIFHLLDIVGLTTI